MTEKVWPSRRLRDTHRELVRASDVLDDAKRALWHGAEDSAGDALDELWTLVRDARATFFRREPPDSGI